MNVLNPRNSMIFPVDSFDTSFQNNCGSYEQAGSTNFVFQLQNKEYIEYLHVVGEAHEGDDFIYNAYSNQYWTLDKTAYDYNTLDCWYLNPSSDGMNNQWFYGVELYVGNSTSISESVRCDPEFQITYD